MSTPVRIALSLLCGILITAATTLAGLYIEHPVVMPILLWQIALLYLLHNAVLGPGPLLGHDAQGQPIYEGTPILFLVFALGVLLAVPIYSCLSYFVLRRLVRRKGEGLR